MEASLSPAAGTTRATACIDACSRHRSDCPLGPTKTWSPRNEPGNLRQRGALVVVEGVVCVWEGEGGRRGGGGGGGAYRALTSVSLVIRTHACIYLNGLVPAHQPLRLD